MALPTVTVLDLTARLGLHALGQLGVANATGQGSWLQIPLGGLPFAPRIDWHRPARAGNLASIDAAPEALAVLVGAGAIHLLPALWDHPVLRNTSDIWFFLMPNALLEEIEIKSALARTGYSANVYQLPDSSEHTLWFIFMEQLGKVELTVEFEGSLNQPGSHAMSTNLKEVLNAAMTIDGATAAALVDYRSGMCLAQAGAGVNLELAAAGNTQVVQAKLKTMEMLGLRKGIEDILITLTDQYHLIRLVPNNPGLFLYLVLDKSKGNLALARYKLTDIERSLRM